METFVTCLELGLRSALSKNSFLSCFKTLAWKYRFLYDAGSRRGPLLMTIFISKIFLSEIICSSSMIGDSGSAIRRSHDGKQVLLFP